MLYLLTEDEVIFRVDADTLETLTRVRVSGAGSLVSLAATSAGVVYATTELDLDLYRVDPISGEAVNVNLLDSIFAN